MADRLSPLPAAVIPAAEQPDLPAGGSAGELGIRPSAAAGVLCALIVLAAIAVPAAAFGAAAPQPSRPPVTAIGTLAQLRGPSGCLIDRAKPPAGCTRVRALRGPAPFLGSRAVAISRDGKNVYVASSRSNAIAVFARQASNGKLTQRSGTAGCIAAAGAGGCAKGLGLVGPNSVAVSSDGKNVYATSLASDAVATFRRSPSTGALTQARDGSGCLAGATTSGCAIGRGLDGPDVVTVSPDDNNVYVGSFVGNAVAVFARDRSTGTLTQPADATGCIVDTPTDGCATGLALAGPEGMAISGDGNNVYVAAAISNALAVFTRNPSTGALTQATDGSGCIADGALTGCTTGTQLGGANAVAVGADNGNVYVTSLLSNSVTTFTRTPTTGQLAQQTGTSACVIYVLAVGCSLGRALSAPEGLSVSSDGASLYTAAFGSGAVDVFNRNADSGALMQKPRRAGCVVTRRTPDCTHGRALLGASSVAVSPDGKNLYSAAFDSSAVGVFKRVIGR
jgi:DNA-binding beta-propeller fold protein YncE